MTTIPQNLSNASDGWTAVIRQFYALFMSRWPWNIQKSDIVHFVSHQRGAIKNARFWNMRLPPRLMFP